MWHRRRWLWRLRLSARYRTIRKPAASPIIASRPQRPAPENQPHTDSLSGNPHRLQPFSHCSGATMGKINIRKLLLGGLVAGVVLAVVDVAMYGAILKA